MMILLQWALWKLKRVTAVSKVQVLLAIFYGLMLPQLIYAKPSNHFDIVNRIAAKTGNLFKENPQQFTQRVAECLVAIDSNWGRRSRWSQISDDIVAYRMGGSERPYVIDIIKNANSPSSELQWLEGGQFEGSWVAVTGNCILEGDDDDDGGGGGETVLGVCSNVKNQCQAGDFNHSPADTTDEYLWTCRNQPYNGEVLCRQARKDDGPDTTPPEEGSCCPPENHLDIVEQVASKTGNLFRENPLQFVQRVAECLVDVDSNWGLRSSSSHLSDDIIAYRVQGNEKPYSVDIVKNANSSNPETQWFESGQLSGSWVAVTGSCILDDDEEEEEEEEAVTGVCDDIVNTCQTGDFDPLPEDTATEYLWTCRNRPNNGEVLCRQAREDDGPDTTPPEEGSCCPPENHLDIVEQVAARTGDLIEENPPQFTQRVAECLAATDSNWGRRTIGPTMISNGIVAYKTGATDPYSIDIIDKVSGQGPQPHWAANGHIGGIWLAVTGSCILDEEEEEEETVTGVCDDIVNTCQTGDFDPLPEDTAAEYRWTCRNRPNNGEVLCRQPREFDPSDFSWDRVQFLNGGSVTNKDISQWRESSSITNFYLSAAGVNEKLNGVCIDHTKREVWHEVVRSESTGGGQMLQGSAWVIIPLNGNYYAATYENLQSKHSPSMSILHGKPFGQMCHFAWGDESLEQVISTLTESVKDSHLINHASREAFRSIEDWELMPGSVVGFVVSTTARIPEGTLQERSDVIWVEVPDYNAVNTNMGGRIVGRSSNPAPEGNCCPPPDQLDIVERVAARTGDLIQDDPHQFTQRVVECLAATDNKWGRRIIRSGIVSKGIIAYRTRGSTGPYSIDIIKRVSGRNARPQWTASGHIGGSWLAVNGSCILHEEETILGVCGGSSENTCESGDFHRHPADTETEYLWTCRNRPHNGEVRCRHPKDIEVILGVCGINVNTCESGDLRRHPRDTATEYIWTCRNRPNNGEVTCRAPKSDMDHDISNFSFSRITWLNTVNVSRWRETSQITSVEIQDSSGEICINHSKLGKWPSRRFGADITLDGNAYVIVKKNGRYYAAAYEWLTPRQQCTLNTGSISNTYHDLGTEKIRRPPLNHAWTPQGGDIIGFMISGLATPRITNNVRERSNIQWYRLPSEDGQILGQMLHSSSTGGPVIDGGNSGSDCCPPVNRFDVIRSVAAKTGGLHRGNPHQFTEHVVECLAVDDSNWGLRRNTGGDISKDTVAYRMQGELNPYSIDIMNDGAHYQLQWRVQGFGRRTGQVGGTWVATTGPCILDEREEEEQQEEAAGDESNNNGDEDSDGEGGEQERNDKQNPSNQKQARQMAIGRRQND